MLLPLLACACAVNNTAKDPRRASLVGLWQEKTKASSNRLELCSNDHFIVYTEMPNDNNVDVWTPTSQGKWTLQNNAIILHFTESIWAMKYPDTESWMLIKSSADAFEVSDQRSKTTILWQRVTNQAPTSR